MQDSLHWETRSASAGAGVTVGGALLGGGGAAWGDMGSTVGV